MKQEEIEPRTNNLPTNKNQTQSQQKKLKLENISKLQKINSDISISSMIVPGQIMEENQSIFYAAQGQRKAINSQKIKQYMQKRRESLQERTRICDTIQAMFFEKQKNTKIFVKNITRYFQDYVDLYASLYKSMGKLQLKKRYQNSTMYNAIKQSISELVQLNEQQNQHVQNFVDWLQKILVQAFKTANNFFKQRVKKLIKDLEVSQQNYKTCWQKQLKAFQKLSDGNDMLQRQLILMVHIKNTNQASIKRANDLYQTWGYLLQEQNTIKRLLRDNILQFYDRFVKFHKKTDSAVAIFKYWSTLPASPTVIAVFSSFLDEKNIQYINFGCKSQKLTDNFDYFIRMVNEQKRVGNPYPFLEILVIKKFTSKLQISQRQWKDIKLIFTVDKNLLLVDEKEGKLIIKLMQSSIKLKRISQNILELNGIEEGMVFDSKRRQSIHFEKLDQVQQFIYYVNSIPGNKNSEQN